MIDFWGGAWRLALVLFLLYEFVGVLGAQTLVKFLEDGVFGKYFNIGEVRMGGSSETIRQKPHGMTFGPSMRMVIDFEDFDKSTMVIPGGESGQVLSTHYGDQWDAYMAGRGFPMQFNKIEPKATLVFLPVGK